MRRLRALLLAFSLALPATAIAATVTHESALADSGGTPNTSTSFDPTIGDLIVVKVQASATVQATATLTSSLGAGLTFTQVAAFAYAGNVHSLYIFVADSLIESGEDIPQTVDFDVASDPSTGTVIIVERWAGMEKTGATAFVQAASDPANAASTIDMTFGAAVTTTNPTTGIAANATNPATLTPPTNWTEAASSDVGYSSPTGGAHSVYRESGFSGTNVVWGAATDTVGAGLMIELDASSSEATPGAFDSAPSCSALDEDTYRCAADAGTDTATIKYCVLKKDTSAPADGAAVETCSGGVTSGSAAATGSSQNIDIDITGDQFPIYDLYFAAKNVTLYGSVQNQLDETLTVPSGRQYVVKSGSPGVGEAGLFDGASPAIADGDYMDADTKWDSFTLGADAHDLILNVDSTYECDCGGDLSQQVTTRRFYDVSVQDWSDPTPVAKALNDLAPIYIGDASHFLLPVSVAMSQPLDSEWLDPEADGMTHAIANAPSGLSVTSSENLAGTPDTCGRFTTPEITATDDYGEDTAQTITIEVGALVPDVIDNDEATAVAAIEALCSITAAAGVPQNSDTVALGNVISVSPDVGEFSVYDGTVTYVLSLGPRVGSGAARHMGLGIRTH